MKSRVSIFATLFWVGCADKAATPCADGFGRDAAGKCVPVGGTLDAPDATDDVSEDSGDAEDTAAPSSTPDTPTWTPPEAQWATADVQTALDDLLGQGVPDPFTVYAGWQTMFEGADPGCPGGHAYAITSTASGCVSDSGWLYAGTGSYTEFEAGIEQVSVLSVDGYIISPDSGTFIGGGTVGLSLIADEDADAWKLAIEGTFGLDTSSSPWFAQTPSMLLYATGGFLGTGREASFLGGWQLADRAVYLDISMGAACEGMVGTVHIWDPSGSWHVLTLDCSVCGDVQYAGGSPDGEVCIDPAPFDTFLDQMQAAL